MCSPPRNAQRCSGACAARGHRRGFGGARWTGGEARRSPGPWDWFRHAGAAHGTRCCTHAHSHPHAHSPPCSCALAACSACMDAPKSTTSLIYITHTTKDPQQQPTPADQSHALVPRALPRAPPNPNHPQPPAAGPGHWPLARPARATPGPGTGGQCRSRPRMPASPPAGPTRRHAHARTHHARTHARAHARTHVRTYARTQAGTQAHDGTHTRWVMEKWIGWGRVRERTQARTHARTRLVPSPRAPPTTRSRRPPGQGTGHWRDWPGQHQDPGQGVDADSECPHLLPAPQARQPARRAHAPTRARTHAPRTARTTHGTHARTHAHTHAHKQARTST